MPTRKYGAGTDADTTGTKSARFRYANPDTNYEDYATPEADGNEYSVILFLDIDAVIADIGSGHTITDVSLKIIPTAVDSDPGSIFLHQMLVYSGAASVHDWDNVSWNEKDMAGDVQWGNDTQAGLLSGTDYDATELLSVLVSAFTTSVEYSFNDSDLTQLVSDWYDGTITNHGIYLRNSGNFSRLTFAGDSYATSADRYYWEITYTESGGSTGIVILRRRIEGI